MRKWKRRGGDMFDYVEGDRVLATIEADRPNSGHFARWDVHGTKRSFETLRDAKRWVEQQQDSTTATTTPEVTPDA